jgi:hypothetical protein
MTALVSREQSQTVVALPEFEAYAKASAAYVAAFCAEGEAQRAQAAALRARTLAEKVMKDAETDLDIAIEKALKL